MNTFNKIKLTVWLVLLTLTLQAQNNPNTQNTQFVPGQILIKLKESAKAQKTSLNSQMKATTLKSYANLGIELWEVNQQANGKQTTLALIEQYKNHPDVEFVEPNYLLEAIGGTEPNDPYFPQLWGLNNTGQDGGTEDADIDAPEAYCMPISALDVVVGILDTGIDYTHEDLAENMWQNLGEDANGNGQVLIKSGDTWIFDPGDENGIDDDGNGYIDDFVGWDFVYNDNDPMDLNSHGTHCAGTIGAVMNNETGINGVAPNAKLAALKFLSDNGGGSVSDAIDALNYAVAMNIPITNNSWGGGGYSTAMYQALQNAEANNHLFIAAAGNYSLDNDQYFFYPASYDNDNVFSVAATDRNDNKSGFSHFGATTVDIGAPGSSIFSCEPNNNYGNKSGTSMATPHIAGVCAFVLGANPGSNYSTIKNALINSVDPISDLNGKSASGGRVNLPNALLEMGGPANPCDDDVCEYPECDDCEAPPCDDSPPIPTCSRLADSLALIALYNSTNGPNWTYTWDTNKAMDTWYGVTLTDGRVTCLDMDGTHDCTWSSPPGKNLTGNIPPEIGNLCNLKVLNLQNNQISGSIPDEIGELTELQFLFLGGNQLSGNLPATLGNLINLKGIWIEGMDNLTGPIPEELGNLEYLEILNLWGNNLTGNIPVELGDLQNLRLLDIRNNNISGTIPVEIGNLFNLDRLRLSNNPLNGDLPSEIGSLSNLVWLEVSNSSLSGCYSNNLSQLCDQLEPPLNDNSSISNGNNFDANWEDFCATGAGSCEPLTSQVWPGDFDNNGVAEIIDLLYWGGAAYNNTGVIRPNASTNWTGQACEDWPDSVNGVNSKHQDGNGDGIVNNVDIAALINNFGQTHSLSTPNGLASTMQFNLTTDFIANFINSDNTLTYNFIVEDGGNTVDAHGVSASIFFGALNVVNANIDIEGSSLNPQEFLEHFDATTNTLHFSLTKTNSVNSPLDGAVCKVVVQILTIDTGESFALDINAGGVMQADGTLYNVAGTSVYDTYYDVLGGGIIALNISASHANCSGGGSAIVNAFGGIGDYSYQWSTGETTQQITGLSPGIYAVVVTDTDGNSSSIEVEVQGQFIPIYDEDGNIVPCGFITGTGRQSAMLIGQAQINGFPAEEGDRLVAFDQNGNIAGMDLMTISSGNAYINMPIYGDKFNTTADEGMNAGEYFTLQIYDASADAYYDYENGGQLFEFAGWENTNGTPLAAYNNSNDVYSFGVCNQSINLNAGWNLISFNNNATDNTVTAVFADLIAAGNLEFITGFDNFAKVFDPNQPPFLNTLTAIEDGFGYWVKITNSTVLTSAGACVSVNIKPLDADWNLIAYTSSTQQAPSDYFADLIADGNLIFVSGFDDAGYKIFDPYGPPFLNSLTQLQNGFGYWVKVTNASAKTANNFTNVFSFINGTSNLPNGEQVTVLNEAGETIANMEVIKDGYLMTTAIYGDDERTALKENIYIGEKLQFSWNNEIIDFSTTFKGDYGIEKVHLEFKLAAGLTPSINVFPNPLAHEASIVYNLEKSDEVSVSLFNANGQQLKTLVKNQTQQSGQHQITLNANDLPNGIYYLQLLGSEINIYKKIVVNK